jgi:NAD-dependent DNA ligase
VRLASELIGARVDIKSESDVKDEVADALAKMLQTAISEGGEEAASETPVDLTEAPGIGAKTAAALTQAGYQTLEALLAASADELVEVEGLGPKTAGALQEWAKEKAEEIAGAAPDEGGFDEGVQETEDQPSTMADQDFMAALSKAFEESEALRSETESASSAEAAPSPEEETETAGTEE